jgi:N-acetylmuramoyl-L-alanine amidase
MPSVLVELGFVTNREEMTRLLRDDYLNKLAQGIYNGVSTFITSFEE